MTRATQRHWQLLNATMILCLPAKVANVAAFWLCTYLHQSELTSTTRFFVRHSCRRTKDLLVDVSWINAGFRGNEVKARLSYCGKAIYCHISTTEHMQPIVNICYTSAT